MEPPPHTHFAFSSPIVTTSSIHPSTGVPTVEVLLICSPLPVCEPLESYQCISTDNPIPCSSVRHGVYKITWHVTLILKLWILV